MESRIVCISGCGEGMTEDDVISWIFGWSRFCPEFADWTFDQITGGVEEFLDKEAYHYIKSIFENTKDG